MNPRERFSLVVAVAIVIALTGSASVPGVGDDSPAVDVDGEIEFHHIDVGQADATLLITPEDETVLIDTGNWQADGENVVEYLEANDIDRIDHLVATHAHADHIGGHETVIEYVEDDGDGVGVAYDSGVPHETQTYDEYLDAIDEYDVPLFEVEEGNQLLLEDDAVDITVLNPPEGELGSDIHYNSVALSVEFGEFSYLATGDAEADAEQRMAEEWSDHLESDVYQAGHHGSYTSSTEPKLEASDPDITVISSDENSQFGHPHDSVLEAFDDRNVETYWTGVHGDVVVTSDGESSAVSTEYEASGDPDDLLEKKPDDEGGEADNEDDEADIGDDTANLVRDIPASIDTVGGVALG